MGGFPNPGGGIDVNMCGGGPNLGIPTPGGGKFVGGNPRGGGTDKLGTEKLLDDGGTVDVILDISEVGPGPGALVMGGFEMGGACAVDLGAFEGGLESSCSVEPGRGGGVPGELGSESYNAAALSNMDGTCSAGVGTAGVSTAAGLGGAWVTTGATGLTALGTAGTTVLRTC